MKHKFYLKTGDPEFKKNSVDHVRHSKHPLADIQNGHQFDSTVIDAAKSHHICRSVSSKFFLLNEFNLVSSLRLFGSEFQALIVLGKNKFCLCSNLAELCLKFDFPPWVLESAGVRYWLASMSTRLFLILKSGVSLALLLSSRVRHSSLDKRPLSSWNGYMI